MMKLSKRLRRVAAQVKSGGVVADIGCDHGFTSIYLVENQLAERVFAMDINQGPLLRAKEHVRQYGLEDRITLLLSDGATALTPGEVDTLLISGMGGALICNILEDAGDVVEQVRELVLSPQSEIHLVRRMIQKLGFCIDREEMLSDQGKYYVILHGVPGQQTFATQEEYLYGEYLIRNKDKVLMEYLELEQKRISGILRRMREHSQELTATASVRKKELEEELSGIQKTIHRMQDC